MHRINWCQAVEWVYECELVVHFFSHNIRNANRKRTCFRSLLYSQPNSTRYTACRAHMHASNGTHTSTCVPHSTSQHNTDERHALRFSSETTNALQFSVMLTVAWRSSYEKCVVDFQFLCSVCRISFVSNHIIVSMNFTVFSFIRLSVSNSIKYCLSKFNSVYRMHRLKSAVPWHLCKFCKDKRTRNEITKSPNVCWLASLPFVITRVPISWFSFLCSQRTRASKEQFEFAASRQLHKHRQYKRQLHNCMRSELREHWTGNAHEQREQAACASNNFICVQKINALRSD